MMSQDTTLQEESSFHDAIYSRTRIDLDIVHHWLAFDSPAGYLANDLPRLKRTLSEAIGDVREMRVLVCGCGDDPAPLWFSKNGARVDAIDISPQSIDNQKRMAAIAGLPLNAVVMDANNLDLPSGIRQK